MKRPAHSLRTLPARAALLALLACHAHAFGQSFISAMAGYIHLTEGDVFLNDRAIHPKPTDFLHVMEGQHLRTAEGKAELMLTPGSFLRVGPHSEIEIESAGLTHVRFRVHAGSAVIDQLSVYEKDSIAFVSGAYEVHFPKPGVYRLDGGDTLPTLSVFRGKAVVTSGAGKRDVKGKQTFVLAGAEAGTIERFNPKEKDPLDAWNQTRSTALAQAARRTGKRDGANDGMDPLYREWLEMTMRRPQPTIHSNPGGSGRSSTPAPAPSPAPKR